MPLRLGFVAERRKRDRLHATGTAQDERSGQQRNRKPKQPSSLFALAPDLSATQGGGVPPCLIQVNRTSRALPGLGKVLAQENKLNCWLFCKLAWFLNRTSQFPFAHRLEGLYSRTRQVDGALLCPQ
jgi:hypothetical protein